jgi:hypothetical protein
LRATTGYGTRAAYAEALPSNTTLRPRRAEAQ